MATISFNIGPNGQRIQDAFTKAYGYQDQIPNPDDGGQTMIANPITPTAFTKQKIIDFIQSVVVGVEAEAAAAAARSSTTQDITTNVVIS